MLSPLNYNDGMALNRNRIRMLIFLTSCNSWNGNFLSARCDTSALFISYNGHYLTHDTLLKRCLNDRKFYDNHGSTDSPMHKFKLSTRQGCGLKHLNNRW